MKRLLIFAVMMILVAGIAYAKNYEVKKKAGDYDVVATIDNNPPVQGDNNIAISVKDSSGKAVTDAKVRVDYTMPAMPGMPAMNYNTDTKLEGSEYKAKMNFPVAGSWNIAVKITKGGKTSTMKFNVDAH